MFKLKNTCYQILTELEELATIVEDKLIFLKDYIL